MAEKKRIFSGIQPSGDLTLGSYMGAIKNWVALQDEYECVYCIVDMHAITVRQVPADLRRRSLEQLAQYIACGLDPKKNIMFIQSHVPQHAELSWVLGCYTQFGELSRMTQFKMKSQQHADNITAGLFTYPVLMAADILLYQSDLVPVGEDQRQHVELCRDIAARFNNSFPDTFTLPEAFIPKMGARIMSLGNPENKMSKSDPDGCVFLMDKPEDIMRKFKRAVTDCETAVRFDKDNKPGISNLLAIYCAATGKTIAEAEAEFADQGYGVFKPAVGEAVVELVRPIREKTEQLLADKTYLESIYKEGAERASYLANKTLRKVYKKVGCVARSNIPKAPLWNGSWREAPEGLILADLQLQVVSDGPIFSLAREKIGEKRALLTQNPPSRICSIDGRASAASHLLIREFLPKAHVIVGDG